ncbi:hypothetical protein OIDMADRAFT_20681 [Oidiodendron maius Zn]|uniref:Uncharacterized protein n=1 Tax=Oidiodendron maius (strain Zn) TaxID=913774 RepID=A0A0C3H0J6_OIDMZ|nr:hypothetical protein OIDMADRAFT_20681 [Oidiodendron maius Zn]
MDHLDPQDPPSRSVSPEVPDHRDAPLQSPLARAVEDFFKSVSPEGFPLSKGTKAKAQPWRTHWAGPQPPTEDGKLIVACPKICTYGSNNLGGL